MSDHRFHRKPPPAFRGGPDPGHTLKVSIFDADVLRFEAGALATTVAVHLDTGSARRLRDMLNHWLEWNAQVRSD